MPHDLLILTITAASIGFLHTVLGPDHYVPFIVMASARQWSLLKTSWITFLCGLGHVLGSVVLGIIGVALGLAVTGLETVEGVRGGIAAWALMAFGLVYTVWGLRRAIRAQAHEHTHGHGAGQEHAHMHDHTQSHAHVHGAALRGSITPWILFTVFVLGPCEPLIPILMYPAAQRSIFGLVVVTGVFGLVTIATMLSIVLVASLGVGLVPVGRMQRYAHALAGLAILLCGAGIQFLGL
jgi:sulfite exporter TauE/SafE